MSLTIVSVFMLPVTPQLQVKELEDALASRKATGVAALVREAAGPTKAQAQEVAALRAEVAKERARADSVRHPADGLCVLQ